MKTFLAILCLFLSTNVFSQENTFNGEWLLQESDVLSETLVKENGIWRDLYKNNTSIVLSENNFVFSLDDKIIQATFEIKNNEFYLYFPQNSEGQQSYTVYNYKLQGNLLILKREDPTVLESYTFLKL